MHGQEAKMVCFAPVGAMPLVGSEFNKLSIYVYAYNSEKTGQFSKVSFLSKIIAFPFKFPLITCQNWIASSLHVVDGVALLALP